MKAKSIFLMAAAVFTTAACSNDGVQENPNFPQDNVIRVTTSISNPKTRAGMTTADLASFYLMVQNLTPEHAAKYSYFEKQTLSGGVWNSANQMLWANNTDSVSVGAVSLYGTSFNEMSFATNFNVDTIQNTADLVKKNDLLLMPTVKIDPTNVADTNLVNGKIKVTFQHALVKLRVKLTLGTEFNLQNLTATNPVSKLMIGGMWTNYKIDPEGMILGPVSSVSTKSIVPMSTTYTAGSGTSTKAVAEFECILPPQPLTRDMNITFKVGDKYYKWNTIPPQMLSSGTQYTLNLTVGKDAVVLSNEGITATPWEETTAVDLGTE